jgi:indole-3-glycerol phosphate synthase
MPTILDEIVAAKKTELASQKKAAPLESLLEQISDQPAPIDFVGALRGDSIRLIAEVKKASPSRGLLCPDFDPVRLADTYTSHGAAAISVLTDPRFQGELVHLSRIKKSGASRQAPVLRKDFIFDPYQVHEARAAGADALLLIVAILTPAQLSELLALSQRLAMRCLVEVHDESELDLALGAGAEVIGINNRDLRTFQTDLSVTMNLAPRIPTGRILVSESGINSQDHLGQLAAVGVNAVLVGEALVTAADVAAKVRELSGTGVAPGEAYNDRLGGP